MEDLFSGLHIYYIPTESDLKQIPASRDYQRNELERIASRRRVGYVLGRSGDNIIWTFDDSHYADDEHGQFEIYCEPISEFFGMLESRCMALFSTRVILVPKSVLKRSVAPTSLDELNEGAE